ncbi:MAG: carboxypeptidase regulatory-like domain-containing protein, partial [Planctomycetes bacterium]|nr:carboxypeptidase regulatory-like domain-containing protein [Planctomycetota bacterium]
MCRTNILRYGLLAFGLILVSGCSSDEDRPDTIPVSGTVMYKGKPVEGATVTFRNPEASRPASGVTDSKGKFQLTT